MSVLASLNGRVGEPENHSYVRLCFPGLTMLLCDGTVVLVSLFFQRDSLGIALYVSEPIIRRLTAL